jgi:hypothetical protein
MTQVFNQALGERFAIYNCDTVEFTAEMPDSSIDFSIYSPPFSSLYVYSESERDMGNVENDEAFFKAYAHLVRELFRVTRPGRLTAVHCSDLPLQKWKDGVIGIKDFSGQIIACHEAAGWVLHSRVTIWKDPVVEMQRTKALGLLYKQVTADSTRSRQGMPDYLLIFRKTPLNEKDGIPVPKDRDSFPVSMWQEWASPVWMTVDQSHVLDVRKARSPEDEKHICPLQLDVIERAIRMWTNEGETVYSPFTGIGSEGFVSLRAGRRFIGTELKDAYFRQACKYLAEAERTGASMFDAPDGRAA